MSRELLAAIKSRGYWHVTIRPTGYVKKRVENVLELLEIVSKNAVELRGWDFPHIDRRSEPTIGQEYVEQSVDWENHREIWRAHQSGQFAFVGGLRYDWIDRPMLFGRPEKPDGDVLSVLDAIFTISEFYEFAARISSTAMGADSMTVKATLHGLRGRMLWLSAPNRSGFSFERRSQIPEWSSERTLASGELLARSRDVAVEECIELFRRFNWDASSEIIKSMQNELRWPR